LINFTRKHPVNGFRTNPFSVAKSTNNSTLPVPTEGWGKSEINYPQGKSNGKILGSNFIQKSHIGQGLGLLKNKPEKFFPGAGLERA